MTTKFEAKIVPQILACLTITMTTHCFIFAQNVFETRGRNCEANRALLDDLAHQVMQSNDRLFVIARLGKGESNRNENDRRLYNVREYLKLTFGERLRKENLLFAESEKVKGAGRIDFYLGSKLIMTVTFDRRSDFCVDCCEGLENIYYGPGKQGPKNSRAKIRH